MSEQLWRVGPTGGIYANITCSQIDAMEPNATDFCEAIKKREGKGEFMGKIVDEACW